MNEEEWASCVDPKLMLSNLEGVVSERKLRLLACGYCRAVWKHITDRHLKGLVRLSEGKAETSENEDDLRAAWYVHFAKSFVCGGRRPGSAAVYACAFQHVDPSADAPRTAKALSLLHCVFGNPFRPVTFTPAWQTSDVMLLARDIYDEKAFDRMPILADALQDAGCDSADILNHLRDPNATHVRGCWAIDLVLSKE
jgi:hypothetical protein